jgi:hypothetical protein
LVTSSDDAAVLSLIAIVSQGNGDAGISMKCKNENAVGGAVADASSIVMTATTVVQ